MSKAFKQLLQYIRFKSKVELVCLMKVFVNFNKHFCSKDVVFTF
jgi:hypothetical protein